MARILLVEDNGQIRTMLRVLLTSSGHDVSEARNGKGVCDMHEQQRFDLVITDLVMPDIDGLEVIMELRSKDQNVRIMAISGAEDGRADSYLRIARKLGALHTLSKPFSNEEFMETVRLALES